MIEVNEIGNFFEKWKRVKLGDVAKIKTGSTNVQDAVESGKYPLFDRSLAVKRSDKYIFDTEAVIIPGEGADFKPKYYKGKFDLHQRAYAIYDFEDTEGKFLFYIMHLIKKELIKNSVGTTVISLRLPHFKNLNILIPPLPEQRKITEILETIDNAIEKTDKIIEKYKRIKQGLMHDLLTKGIDENWQIRSEKTHKFKDSPLGRIPEEWEVGFVIDFVEINPKTRINPQESYPFIEMDAVPIMGKQYEYLSYKKGAESGAKFKSGDILLARITPCAENGKALLVPKSIFVGIGSTEFIVFRPKENINGDYLFYLLVSDFVRSVAIALMEGTSGRQRIPNYVFEKIIKVAVPKLKEEQKRIASILSQIDKAIEKEQKYKAKLEKLKRGLMEDLLTGKIRVNHLINGVKA